MDDASLSPLGLIFGWCLHDGIGTDSARVMARTLVRCADGAALETLETSEWLRLDKTRRTWLCAAINGLDRSRRALEPEVIDLLRRLYGQD